LTQRSADFRSCRHQEIRTMTSTIKTLAVLGVIAAFASPAFAGDVESDPVASGRTLAPVAASTMDAYAMAKPATTMRNVSQDRRWLEWLLNERNVGHTS
jgi:hypothetical protein